MYRVEPDKVRNIEARLNEQIKRLNNIGDRIEDIKNSLNNYMYEPELNKKLSMLRGRIMDECNDIKRLTVCLDDIVCIYNKYEVRIMDYLDEVDALGESQGFVNINIPQSIFSVIR